MRDAPDLRRAFRDELHRILRRATRDPDGTGVHAVRKGITRLRSWLRLVRGPIGQQEYRRHNRRLRRAARALAPIRDAGVMLMVFEGLDSSSSFPDLHRRLRKQARWSKKAVAATMSKVKRRLAKERDKCASLPLGHITAGQFAAGLERLRTEMETAAVTARTSGSMEPLHIWRKRAKNYLHGLSFVEGKKHVSTRRVARLNQLLGRDHDLTLLEAELASSRAQPETSALLSVLGQRRRKLRAQLFPDKA